MIDPPYAYYVVDNIGGDVICIWTVCQPNDDLIGYRVFPRERIMLAHGIGHVIHEDEPQPRWQQQQQRARIIERVRRVAEADDTEIEDAVAPRLVASS